MFDPNAANERKAEKSRKKKLSEEIKQKCFIMIPQDLHENLNLSIREVVCGDPSCSPVDTVFQFMWDNEYGGRGMYGMPFSLDEIKEDDLVDWFPDEETLIRWSKGERVPWPPQEEPEPLDPSTLRFKVGDNVECRVGPDPVTGWEKGKITKLLYREDNWPAYAQAPYQIQLNDGRLIFAPQDTDQVIRADQSLSEAQKNTAPDAPTVPSSSGAI